MAQLGMEGALRAVPTLGNRIAPPPGHDLSRAHHPAGSHVVHALTRDSAASHALRLLDGLVALAFPSACLLCHRALEELLHGPLCRACLEGLPVPSGPSCPRCGAVFEASVAAGLCGPCRLPSRKFRRALSLHPYTDAVRECVHALKYGGRRRLGRILGLRAGRRWLEASSVSASASASEPNPVVAIVAVPLSRARRRERGYNQAEIIARAVSASTGLPFVKEAVFRMRDRPPQAGLTAGQRRRNVQGVFRAGRVHSLEGKAVLLVDDVLTTGATVDAAAQCLLRAGVGAVDVLTLARAS